MTEVRYFSWRPFPPNFPTKSAAEKASKGNSFNNTGDRNMHMAVGTLIVLSILEFKSKQFVSEYMDFEGVALWTGCKIRSQSK